VWGFVTGLRGMVCVLERLRCEGEGTEDTPGDDCVGE
jgi:hypothetical protein